MLEEILKVHESGQFEEAEQRYREWLAFNPEDPEAMHLLAILRRQMGDLGEALDLARRAVDLVPERANFQVTLAGLLLHARQFQEARDGFSNALRLDPKQVGAALGVAQIALVQGDLDAADEALDKAGTLAPGAPQLLALRGSLAQARGHHQEAIRQFLAAAERNPDDAMVQANVALSFAAKGQTSFAEQSLRNAIRLKPDYHAARISLAQLLLKQGQMEAALAEFQTVLETQPGHALALAGRADIRRAKGESNEALADYRAAHEAAPEHPSIAASLIEMINLSGDSEAAEHLLSKHLALTPGDPSLRRLRLSFSGRDEGAAGYLAACREWVEADRDQMEAQQRLIDALELSGSYAEADQCCRELLARNSRAYFARMVLARSALREGRGQEAREQLNQMPEAVLSAATRSERLMLMGLACDSLGDTAGAIAFWKRGHQQNEGLAPLIELVDPNSVPAPAPGEGNLEPAPLFMIGLPGSGAESLAVLLKAAGLLVLGDRLGPRTRPDGLASGHYLQIFEQLENEERINAFRERYVASLRLVGATPGLDVVDWLPFFDVRAAAVLAKSFPGARFLVLDRDLRDCLLTWLGRGSPQNVKFDDPTAAAAWLQQAAQHVQRGLDGFDPTQTCRIHVSELDDTPALAKRVLAFLGLSHELAEDFPRHLDRGRGGLPTRLPEGRYRAYAEVLGKTLTRLE